jgi:hypothetical protein
MPPNFQCSDSGSPKLDKCREIKECVYQKVPFGNAAAAPSPPPFILLGPQVVLLGGGLALLLSMSSSYCFVSPLQKETLAIAL